MKPKANPSIKPLPSVSFGIRWGKASVEIAEEARDIQADLIVLSTHGYTRLERALLGSTAERVVRSAPCPVLAIKELEHDFA
jgi:universal stress protein A